MKLDGKVALITGAASGIGHAIAKRYLEAGGRVVIVDLNKNGAAKAAKELAGEKSAIGVGMDVSKEDQVNAGVEEAVKAFGRIDILVSNAGHSDRASDRGVSLRGLEEAVGDSSGWRVPDDQGLRQAHVQAELGHVDLYGIGAQPRGVAAQIGLCRG
jgi:NAD(P)-dependent dehydrogenase (short-subunit alcohol dehydrogenase family)